MRRVVITGLGVIAPNGNGVGEFCQALRKGKSGLRKNAAMEELKFGCHVAATPRGRRRAGRPRPFPEEMLLAMNQAHKIAALSALEAWTDAGFEVPDPADDHVNWDAGAILGVGVGGIDTIGEKVVPLVDAGKVRRLGSTTVEQVMASGTSARVSGLLALGNKVSSNSSACATGVEAIVDGVIRIRAGLAERMLCGGAEIATPYIWGGFDSMRVLCRAFNDEPEKASRPMSASAGGFIPGAGSGALMVESLESAEARGARIYAEILGVGTNCGGHRGGGSMTAPNPESVQRCIRLALDDGGVAPGEVQAISGHLTATGADPKEVANWATALERAPGELPHITSTKSMVGHTLGAAGAIESVAAVLMLDQGFIHPSLNCEDVHPEIAPYADAIPHELREVPDLRVLMKAGFGFGDVNSALALAKWEA